MRRIPFILTVVMVLFPASRPAAAEPQARVRADLQREPISPLVYGQFIEHLGRCIYGGLWAEMLEDRKFFFPITNQSQPWTLHEPRNTSWEGEGHPYELLTASPWLIVGAAEVTMDTDRPLTGQHSPRIQLPGGKRCGLSQGRLGLVAGKSYTGRIVLRGEASAAPVEVTLVWGSGASDRQTVRIDQLSAEFTRHPLQFRAGRSTDRGRLEITSRGSGSFHVGAVSLMPSDNVLGWRADTLALLRELNSPIYRWPGGNFVSGYNWRDGIGDPDRRPPRKNPAWTGIESNDVGLHEFMDLCRELGTEPYVAVNTGLGDAQSAADQVEYANGAETTPMGRLRAANGHPRPFGVRYWAVGNEMYGEWQLGHMPLADYVRKHKAVVDAMRRVDPSIQLVGVGAAGEWSRTMLAEAADHMELISEHIYWQDRDDLLEHVMQVPRRIREVADHHRTYRREIAGLAAKDIRIALDEWNYWYGPNEFGELGVRYFLQDALGIAAGLHEMFRNSDLFAMANYAQTVNVIGAVKTTQTRAEMESTGLVLALYRREWGQVPVTVEGDYQPLDVTAAWTADRTALTLAAVNPTESAQRLRVEWRGAEPTGKARRWVLTGPGRWAHNDPEQPRAVTVTSESLQSLSPELEIPPASVTLWRVEVK